ncbi:hypothetical protein WN51_04831 [Melipona quadrifasciata]|uniref:Uncharacterized protein n=1 Tax=Melipona quadrifasciata TaxID=166423 RepID=A0A0N0U3Q0_9HYME|nr:hypothetical protein WN51_04831 [Melipona quadrifasciata]
MGLEKSRILVLTQNRYDTVSYVLKHRCGFLTHSIFKERLNFLVKLMSVAVAADVVHSIDDLDEATECALICTLMKYFLSTVGCDDDTVHMRPALEIYVFGSNKRVLPFRGYFFINHTVSPVFECFYPFNVTAGGFGGSMIAGASGFNLVVITHALCEEGYDKEWSVRKSLGKMLRVRPSSLTLGGVNYRRMVLEATGGTNKRSNVLFDEICNKAIFLLLRLVRRDHSEEWFRDDLKIISNSLDHSTTIDIYFRGTVVCSLWTI